MILAWSTTCACVTLLNIGGGQATLGGGHKDMELCANSKKKGPHAFGLAGPNQGCKLQHLYPLEKHNYSHSRWVIQSSACKHAGSPHNSPDPHTTRQAHAPAPSHSLPARCVRHQRLIALLAEDPAVRDVANGDAIHLLRAACVYLLVVQQASQLHDLGTIREGDHVGGGWALEQAPGAIVQGLAQLRRKQGRVTGQGKGWVCGQIWGGGGSFCWGIWGIVEPKSMK